MNLLAHLHGTLAGDPAVRLRLAMPYAGHPPSVNKHQNGAVTARATRPWRDTAERIGRHHAGALALPLPPSFLRMTVPMPDRTRRDPHNYTGTVVKATVDGLVRAGWWTDDTATELLIGDPRLVVLPLMSQQRWGLVFLAAGVAGLIMWPPWRTFVLAFVLVTWALGLFAAVVTGQALSWSAPIWPTVVAGIVVFYGARAPHDRDA